MRTFRSRWFGGNGDHSMAAAYALHKKLDEALVAISGMQQPPHVGESEENCDRFEDMLKTGEAEVTEIARDIYCALTGEEVWKVR